MSQTNVEIVRRAFAAFERGGVDAALAFQAPDLVIHSIPEWPDDPEYHGHDGLQRASPTVTTDFETSSTSGTKRGGTAGLDLAYASARLGDLLELTEDLEQARVRGLAG